MSGWELYLVVSFLSMHNLIRIMTVLWNCELGAVVSKTDYQKPLNLISLRTSCPHCELSLKVTYTSHHMVPNAVPVSSVSLDT